MMSNGVRTSFFPLAGGKIYKSRAAQKQEQLEEKYEKIVEKLAARQEAGEALTEEQAHAVEVSA